MKDQNKWLAAQGYEQLAEVFQDAHNQAAYGKGEERHANDLPFHDQRMQRTSTPLDSPDGMAFQAIKKMTEGLQFNCPERREAELLGAINYLAGIVVWYRNKPMRDAAEGGWTPEADPSAAFPAGYDEARSDGLHYALPKRTTPTFFQPPPPRKSQTDYLMPPEDVVIPDWAQWIAVDKNGAVWAFSVEPKKQRCSATWGWPGMAWVRELFIDEKLGIDWETQLYRRTDEGFERADNEQA